MSWRALAAAVVIVVLAACSGDDEQGAPGGTAAVTDGGVSTAGPATTERSDRERDDDARDDDDAAGDDDDDDDSDYDRFAVDPLPAPDAADVVVPEPAERVTCPTATTTVADADGLAAALAAASPGDVIELAAGRYDGNFVASAEASDDSPIFLCGSADAVLAGEGPKESGYVLHLDGAASWRVVGITVRDGRKGVMVDGGVGNVLQDLTVTSIGDEAIHLRAASTDNAVLDNQISDTGRRREKFGEGVYVGTAQSNWCTVSDCEPDRSDRNVVEGNVITDTTSEAIDIKEGTVDGVVLGNSFDGSAATAADSWVDVKGNGWIVAANTGVAAPEHGIQVHEIIKGWGSGNAFVGNTLAVDADGFGFDLHGPEGSNLVACDNDVTGAAEGISNEPCR
ncbi:MAG: right-handed parallel beta-helix repeat-containing protein [Ilumatobacteraceae bacterium]